MAEASVGSRRALLSCLLAIFAGGSISSGAAAAREFRFGLTPVFLTSDLELLSRLQAYLESETGAPVKLITRRTYQEITSLLVSGQLDAAWICGYPYVAYRSQLSLVAVPLWEGKPLYRSYLIASKDSQAEALDDLRGDVHAFSDPDSNSGWLVTAAALAKRRQTPESFFSQTIFTYAHRNVVRAVASGLAASGSVDGYVYEVMLETEPELVGATRVVTRSELLGFPPIACANSIADTVQSRRFQSALVRMNESEDGRAILSLLRLDGFSIEQPALFDTIAEEVATVRSFTG